MAKQNVTKQLIESDSVLTRMAAAEVQIQWDAECQEYTVTTPVQYSPVGEYHTDDRQDAIDAAHAFLKAKILIEEIELAIAIEELKLGE